MAACSFVGVIANDRSLRHGLVDPPVDPREPGRYLVDGPVEIVDPGLQRDGEVDKIARAAPEHHLLRRPHPPELEPGQERRSQGSYRHDRRRDRDCRSRRAAHPVGESEKSTGYDSVLFDVLCSFGTGWTATVTVEGLPN